MAIRVLVIDDSALVRQLLSEILSRDPELEVVGVAQDPYIARDKIKALNPDVVTLDIEMPRMDGLTFLENLMRLRPLPVLIVSSLAEAGAAVTLQALELGAVDFVTKPRIDIAHGLQEYSAMLVEKVKAVARAHPQQMLPRSPDGPPVEKPVRPAYRTTDRVIAIGASTGGTEALRVVLAAMPPDAPAIVIAQHIPASFSGQFAERLNRNSPMSVAQATDRQPIVAGCAYVAPGDRHLTVERDGAHFRCRLSDTAPVNRHRPSVDVLFDSVAEAVGASAVGAILTGMGDDGARGLRRMRDRGAMTFAQDEASSVVWGMPGAAVKAGAVAQTLPLERLAPELLRQSTKVGVGA